jgi:hypothetical protein
MTRMRLLATQPVTVQSQQQRVLTDRLLASPAGQAGDSGYWPVTGPVRPLALRVWASSASETFQEPGARAGGLARSSRAGT